MGNSLKEEGLRRLAALSARFAGYRTAIVAVLCGVVGLVLSSAWDAELWHHLERDISIALIVSGVISSLIEIRAHARRVRDAKDEERSQNIEAVILNQAMRQIGKIGTLGPLFCSSWVLDLDISRRAIDTKHGTKNRYVSRGTLNYTLVNLSQTEESVILRHELESDVHGTVDGVDLPSMESFTYQTLSRDGVRLGPKETVTFPPPNRPDSLKYDRASGLVSSPPVSIPPDAMVEVEIRRVEAVGRQFPWYMLWITGQAEVRLSSSGSEPLTFSLVERPTVSLRAEPSTDGEKRVFKIADLLPGQGFAIFIAGGETE